MVKLKEMGLKTLVGEIELAEKFIMQKHLDIKSLQSKIESEK